MKLHFIEVEVKDFEERRGGEREEKDLLYLPNMCQTNEHGTITYQ